MTKVIDWLKKLFIEPKSRALDLNRLMQQIGEQLSEILPSPNMDGVMSDSMMSPYAMPLDLYHDEAGMFLVIADQGKLYRMDVAVDASDNVQLAAPVEVTQVYAPVDTARSITVTRNAEGRPRFFIIAATATLNRDGEIDSRALFDSFVSNARAQGMPYLTFFHLGEALKMGVADYIAREDATYFATGLFNEDALSLAAAESLSRDSSGWGASIRYLADEPPELAEVARGVTVPVFQSGWNVEISILPESRAASWFTVSMTRELMMDSEKKKALAALVGDQLANEYETKVDGTNAQVRESGMIVREAKAETAPVAVAPVAPVVTPPAQIMTQVSPTEFVLDDAAIAKIVDALQASPQFTALNTSLSTMLTGLQAALPALQTSQAEMARALETVDTRLAAVERTDEEKQREWVSERPAPRQTHVTYRPSQPGARAPADAAGKPKVDFNQIAQGTLSNLKIKK